MAFEWRLDERKYLTTFEVRRLRAVMGRAARSGRPTAVRAWLLVDVACQTGLRVAELAELQVRDLVIEGGRSTVVVRRGKGGRPRLVRISRNLAGHLRRFMRWKGRRGEPTLPEAPLLWCPRSAGSYSRRALQKTFKQSASRAGLSSHFSIHSLRHTYAVHLYKASGHNLRLVQKQLGHSSTRVTEAYADVLDPDLSLAVGRLYTSRREFSRQHS